MSANEHGLKGEPAREWTGRLDCGHHVSVPWGATAPFLMACVLQHQGSCSIKPRELLEPAAWVPRIPVGVALR